jgi:NAD(P)H-hydrate epimerase
MAEADRRAIAGGTPESVLVERAGRAVARVALEHLGGAYGRRVVVACGKGNNGADGHVAARVLRRRGVGVDAFEVGAIDRASLARSLERADLFVDAMFGTGFRGALEGDAEHVARAAADRGIRTLAVDIPSGVDGSTGAVRGIAVRAHATITFAAAKPGLLFEPGRSRAGAVRVADIGIDVGAPSTGITEVTDLRLPRRDPSAHKWSAGLLVFGGSSGMLGAPMFVAHAAARCGATMVVAALPGEQLAARASGTEVVTRAMPATADGALDEDAARLVLKDVERFRALAVGPGLGTDERARAAARRLVAEAPRPIVVDADGLNALADDPAVLRVRHTAGFPAAVLTPHAGEYERLAGRPVGEDRIAAARGLARDTGAVVLLKGPGTVVATPDGRAAVDPTGSAALATAGTGDVLTGVIAGLLAHGVDGRDAAVTGAYVHGRAAQAAGTGDDLVAIDLIPALHPTLDGLRSGRDPWDGHRPEEESHAGDDPGA